MRQSLAFFTYCISNYINIVYNRNNLQEDAMWCQLYADLLDKPGHRLFAPP